jgi:hypothetical protein
MLNAGGHIGPDMDWRPADQQAAIPRIERRERATHHLCEIGAFPYRTCQKVVRAAQK